jgi:hypothetical protein
MCYVGALRRAADEYAHCRCGEKGYKDIHISSIFFSIFSFFAFRHVFPLFLYLFCSNCTIFVPLNHKNGSNMEANEALKTILNRSHAQAMAGQTVSMDEIESFMNDKVYELTHSQWAPIALLNQEL